jgi:hypothetical protein
VADGGVNGLLTNEATGGIKSEELRMLFIQESGAAIFPELEVGEATKERPQRCRPILVALLFYS